MFKVNFFIIIVTLCRWDLMHHTERPSIEGEEKGKIFRTPGIVLEIDLC
jgi:hypothetical protein